MKRLLLHSVILVILISGISIVSSCKGNKHATSICLPDSTLVGKNLPIIDGSLSEYYSIVPQPYVIALSDSIISLKVKLRHEKAYVPNRFIDVSISNPDNLASKFPYIVFVDSMGVQIKNFRLDVDTLMVKQLDALIKGEPGIETELTFTSPNLLTVEQKDSLALVAKNFNIVANLLSYVESETIDTLLKSYRRAVYELNDWASGFSDGAPIGMAAQMLQQYVDEEKTQANILKSVEAYMSTEQLAEYSKIKASRTKSPYTR
ncbi:MAG: hypothetical protein K2J63_11140 [Muribaculaceae bacterium]|nr:hypothetical protein [Muribaculaceae bacterium]MDE6795841.1 hypothetical protein [Muribaculaceae bacterium]